MATRLAEVEQSGLHGSKAARLLDTIRRDMDLKGVLMRKRSRNEEILSLSYQDKTSHGGSDINKNLRENAVNYPYRYVRWLESQATSKKIVVKVSRDAGEGQVPGGPGDNKTGFWTSETLKRIAYEAGFKREIKAVMGEVAPRGTSVMQIGYHQDVISLDQAEEVGKDPQSVVADVLGAGDMEAKQGQAHPEISAGLATMAQDPMVQAQIGKEGVAAVLARKDSHDVAEYKDEVDRSPISSTRLIRKKIWLRKRRVGEEVGWAPHVSDVEDTDMWWERHMDTVAWVKRQETLFSASFRAKCGDYALDARNESEVARGGKMPSTDSMGSEARQAQGADILEDDEKLIEWFTCWFRRPEMKSAGIRKIVCAACPEEFIEFDEANPFVFPKGHPLAGFNTIPNFYPFFDFTPILPSQTVPERTCGLPLIAVGMTQFEQIAELERLMHESALRHALRLYQKHPGLKDNTAVTNALKNGEDGFAFDCPPGCVDSNGKMEQAILPIQFSGNTLDLERHVARLEGNWVKMMAMPPAVLQGVGTAGTAAQDNMGLAAGERESQALINYFEDRVSDVLAGVRGIMRACYDDEDFIALLGEEGAAVMKEWQTGTVDDGDDIEVTFGARAQSELTVRTKQLMEAIQLLISQVDPVTQMPKYDVSGLIEELCRLLEVGKPSFDQSMLAQLQKLAMLGKAALEMQAANEAAGGAHPTSTGSSGGPPSGGGSSTGAGPNRSEGSGPQQGTLAAGAMRGTMPPNANG